MENEKKEIQSSVEESELQEKVRQDMAEKIAEAAAEVQDEIDNATEATEEDAGEMADFESEIEEEVPVKEPKRVTMNLSSLILSLVGTAILGALLLFGGMRFSDWKATLPEGSTVATVDGTKITDVDMQYYLYVMAMEYLQENAGSAVSDPASYDWAQEVEDGKTAEGVVKEMALDLAIDEVLWMNACDAYGAKFDEEEARNTAKMQNEQMISMYGEELIILNAKRQAVSSLKQYERKVAQSMKMQAVQSDLEANPANYYPEQTGDWIPYLEDEKATYKHILIAKETLEDEGAQLASNEAKRAEAEAVLARLHDGEDFDALVEEVGQDAEMTASGYSFEKTTFGIRPQEEVTLTLGLGEISDVVESDAGFHIVKRILGPTELENYWKDQAKIKVKNRKIQKMSIAQIIEDAATASAEFETMYENLQSTAQ